MFYLLCFVCGNQWLTGLEWCKFSHILASSSIHPFNMISTAKCQTSFKTADWYMIKASFNRLCNSIVLNIKTVTGTFAIILHPNIKALECSIEFAFIQSFNLSNCCLRHHPYRQSAFPHPPETQTHPGRPLPREWK